VRPEYPAQASIEVLLALLTAAREQGVSHRHGIVASTDSWYAGQGFAGFNGYQSPRTRTLVPDLQAANVLTIDQLTSAFLTVASVYKVRAGSIAIVQAEQASGRFAEQAIDALAAVANRAAALLGEMDAARDAAGARMWHPGLRAGLGGEDDARGA
jgi:uridine phosphorylase